MGILDMPPGYDHRRRDPLPRARTCSSCRRRSGARSAAAAIAMIFQDALSALNPVFTRRLARSARCSACTGACPRKDATGKAIELMDRVRIPAAQGAGERLPAPVLRRHAPAHHDRDGARAGPDCSSPTSRPPRSTSPCRPRSWTCSPSCSARCNMGLILITHDLGVVADVADRIAVMYAGRIVEDADVARHLRAPRPPVHRGPARLDPAAGPEGPGAVRDQGPAAEPARHPVGLRVPPALPAGAGPLQRPRSPPLYDVAADARQRLPLLGGGARDGSN